MEGCRRRANGRGRWRTWAGLLLSSLILAACDTTAETVTLGAVGATVIGGQTPSTEIQQTYYLGVFDPQDQIPPTVYRVRVRGQASFISFASFASGWVPAQFADSLASSIGFDAAGKSLTISKGTDTGALSNLQTGRRLVLFGPEGFREAPRDHRLVVVMGSNPQAFFEGISNALGNIAQARTAQQNVGLHRQLFDALVQLRAERDRLDDLAKDVELSPQAH